LHGRQLSSVSDLKLKIRHPRGFEIALGTLDHRWIDIYAYWFSSDQPGLDEYTPNAAEWIEQSAAAWSPG
jgi:hypothetical protein